MSVPAPRLFAPTPALTDTLPCPPDENGITWKSRVSTTLAGRARAMGQDELIVLREFIAAVDRSAAFVAKVEAGLVVPDAPYRANAAAALGQDQEDLFQAVVIAARSRAA